MNDVPLAAVTTVQWPSDTATLPGAGATMRHIAIKAGQVVPRHQHDFEQFLFVASGRGRLTCAQGTLPLEPGTALRLAPGAWHSAEFTSDMALIELNLAAPAV